MIRNIVITAVASLVLTGSAFATDAKPAKPSICYGKDGKEIMPKADEAKCKTIKDATWGVPPAKPAKAAPTK